MLTIIVPVRNESDYITSLYNYFLNSLKNIDYEVLIINDFSDDNTFEQCLSLEKKDNRIKALNNKKKGGGQHRPRDGGRPLVSCNEFKY